MISSPFFLVSEDELPFFGGLAERIGLPVYGVAADAMAAGVVTVKSAEGAHVLRAAPRFCIGFFARQAAAIKPLAAVRDLFEAWSGAAYPEPALVSDDASFAFLVGGTLLPELTRASSGIAALSKGLAQLRAAHELLQSNFALAEQLIMKCGLMSPSREFEAPPTGRMTDAGALRIRQLLPVAAVGLAAIELHFPETATGRPSGGIEAELTSVETHEVMGRWSVAAKDCKPGWVVLSLPAGLDSGALSLELTLQPLAGFLSLPQLSLSAPLPLSRFQARVDDIAVPGALALGSWKVLPGLKVDIDASLAPLPEGMADEIVEVALPPRLCASVRRYCDSWRTDWQIVRALRGQSGILCHPPPPELTPNHTIGVIDGLELDRPARIAAKCMVSHSEAAPVEFGMAILPQGSDIRDAIETGRGFSGWVRASFGESGLISVLAPASPVSQKLYLVTRMADGASNLYAHSNFEALTITFLGPRELGHVRHAGVDPDHLSKFCNPLDAADQSVRYKPTDHAILCHPVSTGIKLGMLEALLPAAAIGATAQVRLGHPEAKPVQFRFALSRQSAAEVLTCAEGEPLSNETVLSAWLEVGQGEVGRIDIATESLATPEDAAPGDINLFILTRMAPASSSADFAWAYIEGLEVILPADEGC
jgi:hypothetical protein